MYKNVNYALRCRFRLAKCGACKTKDLRHKLASRQCAFGFCGLSGFVGVTVGNHSTVQTQTALNLLNICNEQMEMR